MDARRAEFPAEECVCMLPASLAVQGKGVGTRGLCQLPCSFARGEQLLGLRRRSCGPAEQGLALHIQSIRGAVGKT